MIAISSYVHIARERSTLGKAKVWIDRQTCTGSSTYVRLTTIRTMMTSRINEDEFRVLMEALLAGSSAGGLAVQA